MESNLTNEQASPTKDDINGLWRAEYFTDEGASASKAAPDNLVSLLFDQGMLSGSDPAGSKYAGIYSVDEGKFTAKVEVTNPDTDAESALGVEFPYTLDFFGDCRNADHFSIFGKVVGADKKVIVDCRRLTES